MPEAVITRPVGWCDFRDAGVAELQYPPGALVLVAGLPGAGKSTLLARLFSLDGQEITPKVVDGVHIADSVHTRNWWGRFFPAMPRPLIRLSHFYRIYHRARRGIGLITHTRGTRRLAIKLYISAARRAGREVHVILIDVPHEIALQGQHARGRVITSHVFRGHVRRWGAIMRARERVLDAQFARARSVVLLNREAVDHLTAIRHCDEGQ
ncbi:MAG: AAA family ATPase [Corynebacteriales bacterium]|nr:AAA family ATPase [Mycobacteriales bacterium]